MKLTITITCADDTGLIHRATEVLLRHQLNVEDQAEFVEKDAAKFFMRAVCSGECVVEDLKEQLSAALPDDAVIGVHRNRLRRIVIFATTEAHCLGDLLIRHWQEELPVAVEAVISNHSKLASLVEKFDIPFHTIPHEERSRQEHEKEILSCLQGYEPEFLVMAKYMRILSPEFVQRFPNRLINIHHSSLPAFVGAKPYHQAYQRGVKIIGATAHFITPELDQGPIISQATTQVDHTKTPRDLMWAGRNLERTVLAHAIRLVSEDKVFVSGNRTVVFD